MHTLPIWVPSGSRKEPWQLGASPLAQSVMGRWPGMHTGCEAPGQAREGPEPWPCQPNAQSCAEGGGRPRLICTLSASDRDASQVRTHHPPWEGRPGQWVGRGSLGEGPALAQRVNSACRNRGSPGKWGRGRAGEGRSAQDQEPQQLEGQSHSRLRRGAGDNPQGSCLLPTVAPDPIHSSLTPGLWSRPRA